MTKTDILKNDGKKLKTAVRKKLMIQALEKSMGIVTTACRIVDVSRETHYKWLKIDKRYAAAVTDCENIVLDFAESKLHKNIEERKEASIIFYLKTKGRKRGYIERQEFSGPDGRPIEITGINYLPPNANNDTTDT